MNRPAVARAAARAGAGGPHRYLRCCAVRTALLLAVGIAVLQPHRAPGATCPGDCDASGRVTIDELIGLVRIALGEAELSDCPAGDGNEDGTLTIDDLVRAVNGALDGCPAPPDPVTVRGVCRVPSAAGLSGCMTGTAVAMWRCEDRSRCLSTPAARTRLARTAVAGGGTFSFVVAGSEVRGKVINLEAAVAGATLYRSLAFGPARGEGAGGGAADEIVTTIDPATEAAVRALDEVGFETVADEVAATLADRVREDPGYFLIDFGAAGIDGAPDRLEGIALDLLRAPPATATASPTVTAAESPVPTGTATATLVPTESPTQRPSPSPAPTSTATSPPPQTVTPTPTPSATPFTVLLHGTVVDCLTGQAVPGALLELDGGQGGMAISGEDGRYAFDPLPSDPQPRTLRAFAPGFIPTLQAVTLDEQSPDRNVTVALCPVRDDGAIRVVLVWADGPPAPKDLDSHLRGPIPGSDRDFHIFYEIRQIDFTGGRSVKLDIDDTNFGGPETITILNPFPGEYRYCVHDYTNREVPDAGGLAVSWARVQVFIGREQVAVFDVPAAPGTVWEVFRVEVREAAPQIVPVGRISNEADPTKVCG